MDTKIQILSPGDHEMFVPAALAGFKMAPSNARLIGEKHLDGSVDFTYTLTWSYKPDKKLPSKKNKKKAKRSKTKSATKKTNKKKPSAKVSDKSIKPKKMRKKKETISESEKFNKFGIVGPFDDIPMLLETKEIDGRTFQIVEDEGCALRFEGNYQFGELMRSVAIEMGIYKATCITPRKMDLDLSVDNQTIMIRKMYFDELMKFRENGRSYDGLWKGLIDLDNPAVGNKDWLADYPSLWPMCEVIKSNQDSSRIWSEYHRRYDTEKKIRGENKEACRKWLHEWEKIIEDRKESSWPVVLSVLFVESGEKREVKLMLNCAPRESVKKIIKRMIKEAGLKQIPKDEVLFSKLLLFKTSTGKKCPLRNGDKMKLGDIKRVDNKWRLFVNLR